MTTLDTLYRDLKPFHRAPVERDYATEARRAWLRTVQSCGLCTLVAWTVISVCGVLLPLLAEVADRMNLR